MNSTALRKIIESNFETVPHRSTQNEICILCTEDGCHDVSGHRSVNLTSGLTHCFKCQKGGRIVPWLRRHGIEIDAETLTSLGRTSNSSLLDEVESVLTPRRTYEGNNNDLTLPRGFIPLSAPEELNSGYYKLIARMAKRKNLDISDLANAGAGFTRDDPHWEPYVIFPVCVRGHVVYFQGRTYVDVPDKSTKMFPNRTVAPMGASHWVYDMDALRQQRPKRLIVVESILNVLSLKKKLFGEGIKDTLPVCAFRNDISPKQWSWLLSEKSVEEICVLFDADSTAKAWQKLEEISQRRTLKIKMSVAEMPKLHGKEHLDANDDVDAAFEAWNMRKTYRHCSNQNFLWQMTRMLS